jgi:PAS domain S-box-containing protein
MDFISHFASDHFYLAAIAYFFGVLTVMPVAFSSIFLVEPKLRETKFKSKKLCARDEIVIDMLNTSESGVAWVLSDPQQQDNPLVFVSDGFCGLTGYERHEIVNRNCRFLQGPLTNKEDVKTLRESISRQEDISICLVNHRKDGTMFNNQLFTCPLYSASDKINPVYYLGVQAEVKDYKSGQNDLNIGWIYAQSYNK